MDAVDGVCLLAAEHDHRCAREPAIDAVDIAREHEVESAMGRHELEAVARQVAFQEPTRLGLGVGEEQCCDHDATVAAFERGEQSSIRTILRRFILN
jgi:hypothetical protein